MGGGGGGGGGGAMGGAGGYAVTKAAEVAYTELVDRAFRFASSTLLTLVVEENKLLERLRSMKHYFLLDQGRVGKRTRTQLTRDVLIFFFCIFHTFEIPTL